MNENPDFKELNVSIAAYATKAFRLEFRMKFLPDCYKIFRILSFINFYYLS